MNTDFAATKSFFHLPEGIVYLNGNSLGPMPKSAAARIEKTVKEEWANLLITGWNKAGWMQQPIEIGNKIARLIGAEKDHVIVGDTLTIKTYQAVSAAIKMHPSRKVILSDSGNFPADLYITEGLIKSMDMGHELKIVPSQEIPNQIDRSIAAILLTEVDYKTGFMHNMFEINKLAQESGAITIWDLAHSAGAIKIDLAQAKVDFAVGCTYKYLNGGPGSPGFIYVAPKHIAKVTPAISGWLGHAAPFDFESKYRPSQGIERMRIGTPPVLAMAILEEALKIWDTVDVADVRKKSIELSEMFIKLIERDCPMLKLSSPRSSKQRGSQVSFEFDEGYAVIQALIQAGVIGDFRSPNIMRFGICPLYITEEDILLACKKLKNIMRNNLWDKNDYKVKALVT